MVFSIQKYSGDLNKFSNGGEQISVNLVSISRFVDKTNSETLHPMSNSKLNINEDICLVTDLSELSMVLFAN